MYPMHKETMTRQGEFSPTPTSMPMAFQPHARSIKRAPRAANSNAFGNGACELAVAGSEVEQTTRSRAGARATEASKNTIMLLLTPAEAQLE